MIPVAMLPNGHFQLFKQPNERQRKSYHNENRYLTPNPLQIIRRETKVGEVPPRILAGMVTVELVSEQGTQLPVEKRAALSTSDGSYCKRLNEDLQADFSLMINQTFDGNLLRLMFTVDYTIEGFGSCQEKVVSRPFSVYTNKKKQSTKWQPTVEGMKVIFGKNTEETEVWIKGKRFSDAVVLFGGRQARILEAEDNLITVMTPPRPELTETTTVDVEIFNRIPNSSQTRMADQKLQFTYLVATNTSTTTHGGGSSTPVQISDNDQTGFINNNNHPHQDLMLRPSLHLSRDLNNNNAVLGHDTNDYSSQSEDNGSNDGGRFEGLEEPSRPTENL